MKWESLKNKAMSLTSYKRKKVDVEALLENPETNKLERVPLTVKYMVDGSPYLVLDTEKKKTLFEKL